MNENRTATTGTNNPKSLKDIFSFILSELRPRGGSFSAFDIISLPVIIIGLVLFFYCLIFGLGAVTNLNQEFPWGIWVGMMVMVAFAGGAYVLTFVVHILHMEKYHPIIRVTVLNGLLAYICYALMIFLDLGRWWNAGNLLIGNDFGPNSVLFLVAWHLLLYSVCMVIEFSPVVAEWLNLKKLQKILVSLTLGTVVVGITLSVAHQAGLGALFLMAKGKIHPLWYTELLPVLFLVSSIFAGLSLVIIQGSISRRVFGDQISPGDREAHNDIVIGLSKACAVVLFLYFFMQLLTVIHGSHWPLLLTPMGWWYLVEIVGLAAIPGLMFFYGTRHRDIRIIKMAAILTILGIMVNRLNLTLIAFRWWIPWSERYVPSWMEIVITLAIIFIKIWVFRWVVTRMPVLRKPPAWVEAGH